jgi:hypothetical protein
MSSLWGYTEIVLEGQSAKNINALLQRAKEECASEETGYCSEIIVAGEAEYRFGYAMKHEYKNLDENNEFSPLVLVGKYPIMDHFALYKCPVDEEERTFTFEGKIEYEYNGTILKICESTYAGKGTVFPFLIALLGEENPELYYWISSEADYIGETNDLNHKYFNPEADVDEIS